MRGRELTVLRSGVGAFILTVLVAMVGTTPSSEAGVRCSEVPRLSFDKPMRFCMRTDIFIAAVGEITSSTPDEFVAFLNKIDDLGFRPHSVTFHSPGGSLLGGVTLGAVIRKLKLDTHVGEGSTCSSACMLAFIGGWSRKVTHDGRIGNHQIRNTETDIGSIQGIQDLIGFLTEYHQEMNVSPLAVTAAMTRRSHEMYWYSPTERRDWGIVTKR